MVSVVASDPDATIAFYRLLGVEIEDHSGGSEYLHLTVRGTKPADLDIDSQHLAEVYNDGARTGASGRVIIGFAVDTRDDVDRVHAAVVAAGHPSRQVPYDAFWGARYAVIADPDGNDVGIMSPSDDTMRTWPPTPSPNS
jgi:catechol 2,3-dioxygenase-like lactoylglutathione lyase family enzyme